MVAVDLLRCFKTNPSHRVTVGQFFPSTITNLRVIILIISVLYEDDNIHTIAFFLSQTVKIAGTWAEKSTQPLIFLEIRFHGLSPQTEDRVKPRISSHNFSGPSPPATKLLIVDTIVDRGNYHIRCSFWNWISILIIQVINDAHRLFLTFIWVWISKVDGQTWLNFPRIPTESQSCVHLYLNQFSFALLISAACFSGNRCAINHPWRLENMKTGRVTAIGIIIESYVCKLWLPKKVHPILLQLLPDEDDC